MGARIIAFFEKVTETFSYLVIDPLTPAALIIDPVLDYDPAARRIRTHSADAIAKAINAAGLRVEWIPETHVHAVFAWTLRQDQGHKTIAYWRREYTCYLFAEGWPSGLRQRS
jgi:glyoxylase-like metal-dependent hydrolase (beta-lactamase superfamily II)